MISITTLTTSHQQLVVHLILRSSLDYADGDTDGRLLRWQQQIGTWAVATTNGKIAGIAVITPTNAGACLYWLETLPAYQGQGIGTALLAWARQQNPVLTIASVPEAASFYAERLSDAARDGNTFVTATA